MSLYTLTIATCIHYIRHIHIISTKKLIFVFCYRLVPDLSASVGYQLKFEEEAGRSEEKCAIFLDLGM